MNGFASFGAVAARAMRAWKPPTRLSLSEWADERFRMSSETSAEPGRWRTLPYQREIMNALVDRGTRQVTVMKSARIGFTLMLSAAIAYFIDHEPTSMLVVQPTVDDAKSFSKETIAAMVRDLPCLQDALLRGAKGRTRDSSNTLTHKKFRGGALLSLTGANSGSGLRRISRRVIFLDEVDAYPTSAGVEGDPATLAKNRSQAFWNQKHFQGSTPLVAGISKIAEEFAAGDRRRYFVPCPHCGFMAPLIFREGQGQVRGHVMKWDDGQPETAYFVCQDGGCVIEHKDKRAMVEAGEWRAEAPFDGHASFHIWAAYSFNPNSTWGDIAKAFVAANKGGPEKLKVFVNTVLGETWVEKGDAPEWRRLYDRREKYERGTVPAGVVLLTAGADVQRDRLVWEVVGWGDDRQSWSIDADVIMGKTDGDEPWKGLDELLSRQWQGVDGALHMLGILAVDSGDQTQRVYDWARGYPMSRVIAVKGVSAAKAIIDAPTPVDIDFRGKRMARGYKVWPVSSSMAKSQIYGWLGLDGPTQPGEAFPGGYCHFPEYGEEFFKQLTAEQLVKSVTRRGFVRHEWQVIPGRENHYLDCRVYARAASIRAGLDRLAARKRAGAVVPPPPDAPSEQQASEPPQAPPSEPRQAPRASFLGRPGWLRDNRNWLRR